MAGSESEYSGKCIKQSQRKSKIAGEIVRKCQIKNREAKNRPKKEKAGRQWHQD